MKNYVNLGLSVDWENTSDKSIIPTLPTKEHIKELLDKCDWIPTSINNIDGYKIIGNNGNSIFIPFPKIIIQNSNNILKIKNISSPILEKLIADMVKVEGGTFTMGATSEQGSDYYSDERPTYQVTLSDYYIGKYEVTQQLWKYIMSYSGTCADGSLMNAYAGDVWLGNDTSSDYGVGDYYPAYYVSYDDIVNIFLPRLNKITGKTFRLPTEAEWEFAARGGKQSRGFKYSGSDNIGDVAWYTDNSGRKTHQVGTKEPNELGIYDMSGNVFEWCSDWHGRYSSSTQMNPTGSSSDPRSFSDPRRVLRGGGWYSDARNCRVSYRRFNYPSSRYHDSGFRVVLD